MSLKAGCCWVVQGRGSSASNVLVKCSTCGIWIAQLHEQPSLKSYYGKLSIVRVYNLMTNWYWCRCLVVAVHDDDYDPVVLFLIGRPTQVPKSAHGAMDYSASTSDFHSRAYTQQLDIDWIRINRRNCAKYDDNIYIHNIRTSAP